MKKIELVWHPYRLKFSKPFETSKGTVTHRKGFIVELKNENGLSSKGDISPFPEFGSERYEDAETYLANYRQDLKLDLDNVENSFENCFRGTENLPALRCGLEQALFTLITHEKNISLNHIFNRKSHSEVKVNGIIGFHSAADSARIAEELVQERFYTIKLKVGKNNFKDDLEVIRGVSSEIPSNVKLRLDANGKWSVKQAAENIKQLEEFNIEFIEQPVKSNDELCELAKISALPLAADESVRNFKDALSLIDNRAVKYLILKPMMLGGIIPVMKIYDEAKKNNIGVVVTSSFESGVGRAYAVFAASLIEEDIAHGLATQEYFEAKFLPDAYAVKFGVIHLK
jgi:L-Ala-D/L-Glu epimerase